MNQLKKIFIGTLCVTSLLSTGLSARTWSNSDNTKTFTGKFKKYDADNKKVTIIRSNGRKTTFKIDMLSQADQEWIAEKVKEEAEKEKEAAKENAKANIGDTLEEQPIAKNIYKNLTQLKGKKLKKAEFQFAPEYYLLYFSASW